MSFVIDILLLGIVALCCWRGFRTGIINGVCGILAIVIAIYGANLIAKAYSDDFTSMLEPFIMGIVETTADEITGVNADENTELTEEQINMMLEAVQNEAGEFDVRSVSISVLTRLGLTESAAVVIADQAALEYDRVGMDLINYLGEQLCEKFAFVAVFAVAFILISIVFMVLGNIFDLSFGIPGHENLNHITGAALGAIKGILTILVIACFFRYLGLLVPDDIIRGTWIFEGIIDSNKVASILGI